MQKLRNLASNTFIALLALKIGYRAFYLLLNIEFGVPGEPGWLHGTFMQGSILDVAWLQGRELYSLLGLVFLTMLIIHLLPRFTKAVPSSLVAIVVVSGLVLVLDIDTKIVGDVASIEGGLPSFHIPAVPFTVDTLLIIFPYAIILAAIGLIESLLTMRLIDELTESRGRGNKECIGQGVANTVTGFFGGMGRSEERNLDYLRNL